MLFVGTKRQAQDAIAEEAQRCGMFFVNQRWLGGLLTNFTTIQRSLARLRELEAMTTDGRYDTLSKKEIARLDKERRKLAKNLDGIRGMTPAARRGLHRRHPARADRRRRGAQAEDSGHRRRRHQLRSGSGRLRHSGQRRRPAVDSAVRRRHRRRRARGPGHRRVAAADERPTAAPAPPQPRRPAAARPRQRPTRLVRPADRDATAQAAVRSSDQGTCPGRSAPTTDSSGVHPVDISAALVKSCATRPARA